MTQVFDEDGNMTTVKGDTILFDVNNVPTDLDYTVFFKIVLCLRIARNKHSRFKIKVLVWVGGYDTQSFSTSSTRTLKITVHFNCL